VTCIQDQINSLQLKVDPKSSGYFDFSRFLAVLEDEWQDADNEHDVTEAFKVLKLPLGFGVSPFVEGPKY